MIKALKNWMHETFKPRPITTYEQWNKSLHDMAARCGVVYHPYDGGASLTDLEKSPWSEPVTIEDAYKGIEDYNAQPLTVGPSKNSASRHLPFSFQPQNQRALVRGRTKYV